jgi:hypothetical protein
MCRSESRPKALQAEFVKKLQGDMVEQIRRESRAGMTAQFRKQAQEELIEERLKLQEGKRLGSRCLTMKPSAWFRALPNATR